MDVAESLLAAVFASPADDTPRLVYADYLDELGGPANAARAEFIRLQCEHARRAADDSGRAEALRVEYAAEWERPVRARFGVRMQPRDWKYRRGFVTSVAVRGRMLADDRARDVFDIGPLEHLALTDTFQGTGRRERLERLAAITLGFDPTVFGPHRGDAAGRIYRHELASLARTSVLIQSRGTADISDLQSGCFGELCDAIAAGRISPVLVLTVGGRRVVLDPLGLWRHVGPHAEPFMNPAPEAVLPETRESQSVRNWHLERLARRTGRSGQRSLLSRAAGWLRGR